MRFFAILSLSFFFTINVHAQWNGKVIDITDGDTYVIKKQTGKTFDVRLYGIDCPESDQSFGDKATNKVSDKILYERVKVKKVEAGPYGRLIGKVYYNSTMINEWLVKKGLAWVSGKYCNQAICDHWKEIQKRKRDNKVGLWIQNNPVPPWDFR